MVRELGPVTLLSIPIEIRLRILELSIDDSVVHVREDGAISCVHDEVLWSYVQSHNCKGRKSTPGPILSCRQLFHEAIGLYFDKTTFAFACPKALSLFVEQRKTVLPYVRRISIQCGPAKHTTNQGKVQIRHAFEMLRQHTPRLCRLWIRLCSYKNMHSDQNLFSNFWLRNLWRLRMPKELYLDIGPDLPGPVLSSWKRGFDQNEISMRIHDTCSMLRQYNQPSEFKIEAELKQQLTHATLTIQGYSRIISFPT